MVYIQESDYDIGMDNDPVSYQQAIESNDSFKWIDDMKEEMKSMERNEV